MTRTQINLFMAVARERSFTRAANTLYISQPAISKCISSMEKELGFKLFEKQDNEMELTAAGGMLHEFFQRSLDEYETVLDCIKKMLGAQHTSVRIGCPETWDPAIFYNRIESRFSAAHPNTQLVVESCKLSDLIVKVQAGKLDAVLTHDFYIPALYGIASQHLTSSSFGVLYSKAHFQNVTALSDFRDTDFLLFDHDISKKFTGIVRNICEEHGFSPKIKNSGQMSTALYDVARGWGVMLFSDWDSVVANNAYGFLPLQVKIPIRIIYPEETQNGATAAFVRETVRLLAEA